MYEAKSKDRDEWNLFVARNNGSFLQSWEWGEFQRSLGRTIYRVRGEEWQALAVKHELPFGKSYLYCPRGPALESRSTNQELRQAWEGFLDTIKEIAKQENSIFLRVDPEVDIYDSTFVILNSIGFRKSSKEVQPKRTLIVDLTKSEDELLKEMHSKTRYNIRIAERHGVKIKISDCRFQIADCAMYFEEFWRLLQATAKRDGFRAHSKEYYQKQLDPNLWQNYNGRGKNARGFTNELFIAEYQEKTVAGAIVNFWNKRATYLHGASDYNQRSLMAPYLLHWKIMLEAKRRGCKEYDFWGIDEQKWPGITRFKNGFGGKKTECAGAWDFPMDSIIYPAFMLLTKLKKFVNLMS